MHGAHRGQRRVFGFPGTGVTDGDEPPRRYWEQSPGSPEEQIVPFSQCAVSLARLFKDSKGILSVCFATIGHRNDTQEFKNPGV